MEIQIYGLRALVVENNLLRITFLVDKGMEILEFNHKQTDTDLVWRTDRGLSKRRQMKSPLQGSQFLSDYYTGGWFECFPNVGEACIYKGAEMPMYGEVCYLPWEYSVVKDTPEEVVIRSFTYTVKSPYYIEKIITIQHDVATLFLTQTIKNIGLETLCYQWGFHPNISPNFCSPRTAIDMPDCGIAVRYSPQEDPDSLKEGSSGIWPLIGTKNGGTADLSFFDEKESRANDFSLLKKLQRGHIELWNETKALKFSMDWDIDAFPHCSIWRVTGNDEGYPRYGGSNVLGFVITNDLSWGLDKADEDSMMIDPGEEKTGWFNFTVRSD